MYNNLDTSETESILHPINILFSVRNIRTTAGKAILGLTLREEFADAGGPSCGSLGIIVEYATKVASHGLMDCCYLVEYEASVISRSSANEFIVTAEIDYSHKPNAIFYCKVSEAKGSPKALLAVCHGILLGQYSLNAKPH